MAPSWLRKHIPNPATKAVRSRHCLPHRSSEGRSGSASQAPRRRARHFPEARRCSTTDSRRGCRVEKPRGDREGRLQAEAKRLTGAKIPVEIQSAVRWQTRLGRSGPFSELLNKNRRSNYNLFNLAAVLASCNLGSVSILSAGMYRNPPNVLPRLRPAAARCRR